jgi:antitoxin ParD1/3/4
MNISLTSELDQFVSEKVKTGMYQTASEVIREGLRLLKERDQRLESLRREVRDGFDAIGRGEFSEYDAGEIKELSDRVNARGRKRLIAEKSKIGTS